MQEPGNDRLEEFFRKAVSRPDVPFQEADWQKLEARLDALDQPTVPAVPRHRKVGVISGVILLFSVLLWTGAHFDFPASEDAATALDRNDESLATHDRGESKGDHPHAFDHSPEANAGPEDALPSESERMPQPLIPQSRQETLAVLPAVSVENNTKADLRDEGKSHHRDGDVEMSVTAVEPLSKNKVYTDLAGGLASVDERNKQRAIVKLPCAGEEDESAVVMDESSRDVETQTVPRLSLLLSFAPDFSGTGLNNASAPGRAFGSLLEYRVTPRFSLSAGAILNNKRYTGDGESYNPPTGYWKYYTNGIVPTTIDGSCKVLEFPIAMRYELVSGARNRFTMSVGTSSYMMRDEVYEYHFADPNPGAHDSWSSSATSRFFFNTFNVAVAWERKVLPGVSLGLEPYLKVPLEGIGWSDMKLYSAGLAITARYHFMTRPGRPPN